MSLNQLFNQFVGGQDGADAQSKQQTGGLSGLASNIPGGLMGGLAAGGLLGVLAGNKKMRKKAGKLAGGAAGLGGAAVLGAVAYSAYKNWQSGKADTSAQPAAETASPAVSAPQEASFDPTASIANDGQPFQVTLIKAMIAAANADGHIDKTEMDAVFETVNKMQLDGEDKALIFDTLQNPPGIDTIASLANGLEQASEIYLVSRMAIDPDHPSERAYLSELAARMYLPEGLVAQLESQMEQAEPVNA